MKREIKVVAAIIEKGKEILIAKRNYGKFEGLWEFPGGKYEKGESGEEAIVREIKEEFDAEIEVKDYLCTVEYDYEDFYLIMDCYICNLISEQLYLHDHSAIQWIQSDSFEIDWVPADIKVMEEYRKRKK